MKKYSDDFVKQVWQHAKVTNEKIKDFIRQDLADAWIDFKEYGKQSDKGWVIACSARTQRRPKRYKQPDCIALEK